MKKSDAHIDIAIFIIIFLSSNHFQSQSTYANVRL